MTGTSPYELIAPTRWAEPPKQYSFSSLQALAACPRRWQLVHSEWGSFPRFPERSHPSAIEGQIVHEALDLLSRALGRVGRPPLGSQSFQAAAADCGFWTFFASQVDEWNARANGHPRTGPGFVIRTPPRELANRTVRLFREQYRPGGGRTFLSKPPGSTSKESLLTNLKREGALSEVRLEHPALPLAGILDLVACDGTAVVIVDFKTGAEKDSHRDQLLLYATLWWRVTGQPPARIEVQYLDGGWDDVIKKADLEQVEKRLAKDIEKAADSLRQHPAPARATQDCAYCPVRARCDEGWPTVEPAGVLKGRTIACEVTVASAPTPTGFIGRRRSGTEVAVVFESAVGHSLPALAVGCRLRLIDAVPTEDGRSLQLRAWSECYLL